jgi:hypothetical protein
MLTRRTVTEVEVLCVAELLAAVDAEQELLGSVENLIK